MSTLTYTYPAFCIDCSTLLQQLCFSSHKKAKRKIFSVFSKGRSEVQYDLLAQGKTIRAQISLVTFATRSSSLNSDCYFKLKQLTDIHRGLCNSASL